jgi:drug/metabolite transporter (DMT)-like permease
LTGAEPRFFGARPYDDRVRDGSSHPLAGFGIVILAASLFGTLGPLSRFAYDAGMEPLAFVGWRALIGFIAVAVFVGWRLRRGDEALVRWSELPPRERLLLGVAALAGFLLNFAMFIAFDLVTIALALLAFYTFPAMVAAAAVALGRERLDRPKLAALGLALAGMVAVVAGQLDPSAGIEFNWLGVALALVAAVCQATFVTISRDGYRSVPTDQAMTVILLTTVACAFLIAVATGALATLAYPLTEPSVVPLVVFTGLFAAAIPSLAFLTGIRLIGGLRAGILMLIEPVVGVLLAALLLDEGIQPIQLLGGTAILAAAIILQRAARDEPEVEPAAVPAVADAHPAHLPGAP